VNANRHQLGQQGENSAASFLISRGYKIIEKNFRTAAGEIDIIAQDKNTLVFVEVKARQSLEYGFPEEAVTQSKIATITRVGEYYSKLHPEFPQALRIDVLALGPKDETGHWRIKLFKNIHQNL